MLGNAPQFRRNRKNPVKCLKLSELNKCHDIPTLQNALNGIRTPFEFLTAFPESVSAQGEWTRMLLDILGDSEEYVILLKDWNVFSLDGGVVQIVEGFRASFGERRNLMEAPGHLFGRNELDSLNGFLRLIMAFEWGAYVMAIDNQNIIIDIFDRFVRVICPDENNLSGAWEQFAVVNATPLPLNLFKNKNSSEM